MVRREKKKQEKNNLVTNSSLADFQTAQVIYHNPTWQSLYVGAEQRSDRTLEVTFSKATAASLLFRFDPRSCGPRTANEERIGTRD